MAIQSLYPAIKPSLMLDFASVKALDPRVSFTRTTTATYYDGKTTAKAEENLLLYSQEFDNAGWEKTAELTVTANTIAAPDGTTTADTFAETAATPGSGFRAQQVVSFVANTRYVLSCFVKDVDVRYVVLELFGVSSNYSWAEYDLDSTGSVSRSGSAGTGWSINSTSITASVNGYFRIVLDVTTGTTVSTPRFRIMLSDGTATINASGNFSYTGTNKSAYFWGAQLEQRSSVTAYTPTTTQPITNYIPTLLTAPAGVARFDHNPTTGESLGLLVEEQRTNLVTYSEDFANAAWTKTRSSITANTIVAPDGTLTGDKLVENTDNNTHFCSQNQTLTANAVYTSTVYVKGAERTGVRLQNSSTANWATVGDAYFDLSAGTVVSGTGTITSVGNGWYRCSITGTFGGSNANGGLNIFLISSGITTSYTGDGYSGIFIWGAQLEAGSFSTSYIPTVAATVTRNADAASMTGTNFSSWFNNAEGTLFADWSRFGNATLNYVVSLTSDISTSAAVQLAIQNRNAVNQIRVWQSTIGGGLDDSITLTSVTSEGKAVTGYGGGTNVSGSANGGTIVTMTNQITDTLFSAATIGSVSGGTGFTNGHIRKLSYYPIRLSDAQLVALTA